MTWHPRLGTPSSSLQLLLRFGQVGLDDSCVASCQCDGYVAVDHVDVLLVMPHHVLLLALLDELLDEQQCLGTEAHTPTLVWE